MTPYVTDVYHWRRIVKYLQDGPAAEALGDRISAGIQGCTSNCQSLSIDLSPGELELVRETNSRIRWRRETGAALGVLA